MTQHDIGDDLGAPLAVWVVPYVATLVMPALWLITENWPHAFNPRLFFLMGLWTSIASVAILLALRRWARGGLRWSLGVAAIATLVLFQWPTFTRAGEIVTAAVGARALTDVFVVVVAGGLIWIAWRRAHELPFAVIIGFGISAATVAMVVTSLPLVTAGAVPARGAAQVGAPDVVVIMLDGHASNDWYAANNLEGGSLLSDLAERGFIAAPQATANYSYTIGGYASMLNLDYVFDLGPITDDELELTRSALMGEVGMVSRFRAAGYETAYVENTWGGSQCGPAIDHCIGDRSLRRSLWAIGQMTIFAPLVGLVATNPFNAQSLDQFLDLDDIVLQTSGTSPRLTIAHFIVPHPPLALRADCSRQAVGSETRWVVSDVPKRTLLESYAEQSRCVNTVVIAAVDQLLAARPQTHVMIVSDHGPGPDLDTKATAPELSDEMIKSRMKVLSAYYLPDCETAVPPDVSPVNGARIITSCALDDRLDPLPDHNYWIMPDGRGSAEDVSAVLER